MGEADASDLGEDVQRCPSEVYPFRLSRTTLGLRDAGTRRWGDAETIWLAFVCESRALSPRLRVPRVIFASGRWGDYHTIPSSSTWNPTRPFPREWMPAMSKVLKSKSRLGRGLSSLLSSSNFPVEVDIPVQPEMPTRQRRNLSAPCRGAHVLRNRIRSRKPRPSRAFRWKFQSIRSSRIHTSPAGGWTRPASPSWQPVSRRPG